MMGQYWVEPHLFWLAIALVILSYCLIRLDAKREREYFDQKEIQKHQAFKNAMDKK